MTRKHKKENSDNLPVKNGGSVTLETKKALTLAKQDPGISLNLAKLTNKMKGGNRRTLYAILRVHGHTQQVAAGLCGYHPQSGWRLDKQMQTNPKYQREVTEVLRAFPDAYRDFAKARLPDVAEVEAGALEAMKEDPTLAVKHPGILRGIKSAVGITDKEETPQDVVNIDKLQMLIQNDLNVALTPDQAIDGEVVEPVQIDHDGGGKESS